MGYLLIHLDYRLADLLLGVARLHGDVLASLPEGLGDVGSALHDGLPGGFVAGRGSPRGKALEEVVESQGNSLVARNIEVGLNRRQAVDQLLLISQPAGLLPYSLLGEFVARADHFAGSHAARDPSLGVKGEAVEIDALFGVARGGGVGNVVL